MRILLLMVSNYCSKGWIFVPTSGKPGKWCATRQVDKLNNENFSFPVLYVPGFFMLHFEVSLCDTPLVSGYLSFAEPVC